MSILSSIRGAAASVMLAAGSLLPDTAPQITRPAYARQTPRQKAAELNQHRQSVNRAKRREPEPHQAHVALLTNWQRSQWARAGYPKDIIKILEFASTPRRAALI